MLSTLHINELIDTRYLILKKIGKGGMSVVYQALDKETDKKVALKFLNPVNTLPYLELVVKFRNEVKVISKLDHPNIIKFHTTGDYNGVPYLVTELLQGDSLAGILKKGVKLSIKEALTLIGEVAEALHCVHSHNIIHRDVKPSNIFVVNSAITNPKVKLLDFGLAHIMELSNFEKNENMSGTFSYMSPEATGIIRKQLDERSDLYSVGVILYYLLTGQLPFQSSTAAELLHQIAAMRATPLNSLNPHLPDVIVHIVNRLLAKDQDERYQSANGLLHDIKKYLKNERHFTIGEGDKNEIRLSYQTKFVGREEELTKLKGLINKAARRQGGICLIGGEPGVGKTRLVKAIKEYVYIRGYNKGEIFIESHCMAQENKVPYQAFKHALDEFIQKITKAGLEERTQETKRIRGLAGELGAVLMRLNPNLRELLGSVPELPSLEPEKENIRFTITAAHFICNLIREDQVGILFLDDLQWADEGSLRLLEHIGNHIGTSNLLILGTYRSNEVDEHHPLNRIKKNTKSRGDNITDILIAPLSRDRVMNMVANLLKSKSEYVQKLARYISDKTAGNPFFTITLLKEIVEQKAITWEQGNCAIDQDKINSLDLPNNILDMMLVRTKNIPADLEDLLEISAVVGKEFRVYLLYNLIDKKNHTEVMQLIDQAVARNLLEHSLSDKGKIRFAHDRIRESFLAKISKQKYVTYHLQIASFFLKNYKVEEEKNLFQLTYHLMEGKDEKNGLQYALLAGAKAKKNYASNDAITYYVYAKKILEKNNTKNKEYIDLLEKLGECYKITGNFNSALETLELCNTLVPNKNSIHKSRILAKIGDTLFEKGEVERSFYVLEHALNLSGIKIPNGNIAITSRLLSELLLQINPFRTFFSRISIKNNNVMSNADIIPLRLLNILYKWYFFKDMKKSLYCHLKCLNLAEKMPPSSELAHCYVLGCVIWASIPLESKSERYAKLAIDTAQMTGDRLREGTAYAGFSLALLILNKPCEGLKYAQKGIQLLKGLGEYLDLGVAYAFRVQNGLLIGKLNSSLAISEEFIALSSEAKVLQNLGWALITKGKSQFLLGNVSDSTVSELKRAYELMKETRDNANMLFSLSTLASLYLRQKKYLLAIKTIEKVVALFPTHYSNGAWTLDLFPLGAQIYLDSIISTLKLSNKDRKKFFKRAHWFCKKSLKWSKKFKFIKGWACQVNGTYLWLIGKKKAGIRCWQQGITFLKEETQDKYRIAYIQQEMGSLLLEEKDAKLKKKAKDCLAEAQNIFKDIGAEKDHKNTLLLLGIKETLPSPQQIFNEQETTPQQKFSSERKIITALETSRYLSSILDLDELLEKIMDKAIELLGAEKGILFLYPENKNIPKELKVRVARNIEYIEAEEDTFFTSRSVIKKVEKEKKPLIIEDAVTDNAFKEQISVINYSLRSVLCVPIQHRNTLLGVIYLDNRMITGLFNKEDLWVLELISSQAGVSIENARLFKKSVMDALTEIYNRAYFDNFLLESSEKSWREKTTLSLILIDVDNFKIFNDSYGHQVGDTVLQTVAQIISSKVRKHDVAARYGGDEFAVILPDTDKQQAGLIGKEINTAVRDHKMMHQTDNGPVALNITVSIGVAEMSENDRTALIKDADNALYEVKKLGRNCVVIWGNNYSLISNSIPTVS
ncbi:MAG: diguanylate cyclase [Candidatus Electrothrix sp. AX1]|nr:diguanylate cyclase [Candidatus Electrothrix sp. AX1]